MFVCLKIRNLHDNLFCVGHGGGWGYSGHSIEAIRFMADTDIVLVGFGLFGGRGEYTGKIKVNDLFIVGYKVSFFNTYKMLLFCIASNYLWPK